MFYTSRWEFDPAKVHGKSLVPLLKGETDKARYGGRDFAVCSSTLISHSPKIAKCAIITEDGWCLHYAGNYAEEEADKGLGAAKISIVPPT